MIAFPVGSAFAGGIEEKRSEVVGVQKYKPVHTPHALAQRVSNTQSESLELIARSKAAVARSKRIVEDTKKTLASVESALSRPKKSA
jgi:hypothetical protein